MDDKLSILFVLPEYIINSGGGIITFYRRFLPLLAAEGHKVRVVVGSGVATAHGPTPMVINGVSVEMLEDSRLRSWYKRFERYSALPGLRRLLAGAWALREQAGCTSDFDLVEAADWGLLFVPWVVTAGPPVVVQLHGSVGQIDVYDPVKGEEAQGQLVRLIERASVAQATARQAYSVSNAKFWCDQSGLAVDCILPAWQPLIDFAKSKTRHDRGLVVARVQRWKGPEVLCEALRLLGKKGPSIDWVGRDTTWQSRSLKTSEYLTKNWPEVWGQAVRHLPQQPFEATARLQAEAAFVVVPSLWDTFNFTCVEAMGAGTPVICSTGAGASELIEHGINGFVFENGSAESLAACLEKMLSLSDSQRRELGEAGRRTVKEKLDPVVICEQRLEAYRAVVRSGPVRPPAEEDWLRHACQPELTGSRDRLDFLDHLPLKSLVQYCVGRGLKKLLS